MSKDRRLGRGLAALLGEPTTVSPDYKLPHDNAGVEAMRPRVFDPEAVQSDNADQHPQSDMVMLGVYEIEKNPFQPRRDFTKSEIASLAESLKEHDMLQPVVVRRAGDRYQLISGERRLRAAIHAGWAKVPARVREADDRLVAELAIVENLQRQDLNPIEKALSFHRYIQEHGCTQEDLARRIKIDRSTIANLVRLIELPEAVQDALRQGNISAGHARALLPLGDERLQLEFTERIQREAVSVRETERQGQEMIREEDDETFADNAPSSETAKSKGRTPNHQIASLEQELRIALGTKVEIRQGVRRRGRIVVHFSNELEFDRIRDLLSDSGTLRSEVG